jgi:apolipoprotein N-acyltransferase
VAFRRERRRCGVGVYDKHRLVPFGEFMPLGDLAAQLGSAAWSTCRTTSRRARGRGRSSRRACRRCSR